MKYEALTSGTMLAPPDSKPLAAQLHLRIEEIGKLELDRYLRKAGPQDSQAVRELEDMIARIAGKIALPIVAGVAGEDQDPIGSKECLDMIRHTSKLHREAA